MVELETREDENVVVLLVSRIEVVEEDEIMLDE